MAKRHAAGTTLVSQVRRCQELLLSRAGVDEFHETLRLLLAKVFREREGQGTAPGFGDAQRLLLANAATVARFVDGGAALSAPEDVCEECLRILAPSRVSGTAFDVLHAVFEQMTAQLYKADKGQYFTPPQVVDFCIDVLRPAANETVCDPACGSGAFLERAFGRGADANAPRVFGFDISRRAAQSAALLSFLACGDALAIRQLDALASVPQGDGATIEGAMQEAVGAFDGFDVIATNPPFAGDVSDADFLKHYETAGKAGMQVERDVLFLERCVRLLRPGGRLAIVLPDNKFSAAKFAPLREWLLAHLQVVAVVSLHPNTFRPYTSQKACVLFGQKARDGDAPRDGTVAMYRSDRPGKTATGELVLVDGVVDHDLDAIAADLIREWRVG